MLGLLIFSSAFFLYCFSQWRVIGPYLKRPGFIKGAASWLIIFPFIFLWSSGLELISEKVFGLTSQEQVAVQAIKGSEKNSFFYLLISFVVLIVPIIEEILFRGFLQNWLRGYLKPSFAILITSVIFALFHFSPEQGWSNITILSSLFILSCFLGYLVERTQSLRTSMGLHSTFNLISVIAIFAKDPV